MNSTDRFQQRQKALRTAAQAPRLVLLPGGERAATLAAEPVDASHVDAPTLAQRLDLADPPGGASEVKVLLAELAQQVDRARVDATMDELQANVLHSVAVPFGLGKLLSAYDRDGGSVNTTHNVRAGVYATEEARQRYQERGELDKDAVHKDKRYKEPNAEMKAQMQAGTLFDTYTGEQIRPEHAKDKQLKPNLDHKVAAQTIHDDPARVLAEIDVPDLANDPGNLAPTTSTVNGKKKAHGADELAAILAREAPQRAARLAELERRKATGETLTDQERKEYIKLDAQGRIDIERMKLEQEEAQAEIDAKVDRTYYTSGKFATAALGAGATEGAKAGMQQGLGILLVEFLAASMDELRSLYRQGRGEAGLREEAAMRLGRVAQRVSDKWRGALAGMRDGFLSGFLSSLVTTVINMFVTTGARVVRMVREGFFSLLRALKLLLLRPEGMTRRQALHEASKVLVGAAVLVGGIALEQVIATQLQAWGLGVFADAVTAALVGALVAITTGFALYLLDKADLLNVNAMARHVSVGKLLDVRAAAAIASIEKSDAALSARGLPGQNLA
jgi:hypothetical protein